jgi:leucyl aminopeptidase (aminopeptidase T)
MIQIQRDIQRKNEEIYWAPRSRDVNGFLNQAGTLRIEGELESGKNLEVTGFYLQ